MIITICTSNVFVWGLLKDFASVLCASIFLLFRMINSSMGTNNDAVTSVDAVSDFHLGEPEVLFRRCDLEV